MEALKVGDPMQPETELGPLASADAVAALQADVQKTVAAGARVLTGGKPVDRPGSFYAADRAGEHPEGIACLPRGIIRSRGERVSREEYRRGDSGRQ